MQIGFIGAGNVGKTIARHLITAGHQVVISNSRGPESLKGFIDELGPRAKAGTKAEGKILSVSIRIDYEDSY
jgi:hypothetical protein